MKLSLEADADICRIHAYTPGRIDIALPAALRQQYAQGESSIVPFQQPLILATRALISEWTPRNPMQPDIDDLSACEAMQPEVLLLGAGERQLAPDPRLLAHFAAQGIGLEVMTTIAACRTFNIIAAEGREVVAALII